MSTSGADIKLALQTQAMTVDAFATADHAWENIAYTPVTGRAYVTEQFVPGPRTLLGLMQGGTIEHTGLYVLTWYGIANTGTAASDAAVDAILSAFPPGLALPLTTGDQLRVRADVAPYRGQARPMDGGRSCTTVTIPWRLYSVAS